jgi:hypothetical protein
LEEKGMKKIFYYIIAVVTVMCLAIVPAVATEAETEAITEGEVVETATEAIGAVTETEQVSEIDTKTETETEADTESETETTDIVAILGDADSRLDAIVKLAGTMGITLEEAEALLDKMVALGDEHFGEHDFWLNIRESIENNPDTWTIAILTVLMLLALVIFLIRGLIKNTREQSKNRINIEDIKKTEAVNSQRLTEQSVKLSGIENEHADIKAEIAEINAKCELTQKATDIALSKVDDILTKAVDMFDKVEVIERNSANALKVNVEQALETVELLNIAMGRKLPTVSETTRKVWRDNAVSKIKAFASEEQDATATEDKTKT